MTQENKIALEEVRLRQEVTDMQFNVDSDQYALESATRWLAQSKINLEVAEKNLENFIKENNIKIS